jgi:hypothetical protein
MHQRWAIHYHGKIYFNTPGRDFTIESLLAKPQKLEELDWWAYTFCITLQGWARQHHSIQLICIVRQGWARASVLVSYTKSTIWIGGRPHWFISSADHIREYTCSLTSFF